MNSNGDLYLPVSSQHWFSARPDWVSAAAGEDAETGLFPVESIHYPGTFAGRLVFTDGNGGKRQQFIYPASADPETLHRFATDLSLDSYGFARFTLDTRVYQGVVDFTVISGPPPPDGGVKTVSIPDANGDGIDDLGIIYPNGEQQTLFVRP